MSRISLYIMMFFQYLMYAVWWVPLAAYLTNIGVTSVQKSFILSSMAIGCLASPFFGMIADRYISGQKLLFSLNILNSVFLFMAAQTCNPTLLFVLLMFTMLFYMPTWGLTSAIAMTHSPSEEFPRIRVFGSIGWVASGLFSVVAVNVFKLDFDGSSMPFYFGATTGIVAAVLNLFLPDTAPAGKGKKVSFIDMFGLGTLKLMKDRNFAIFIVLSFLSMIPFAMYFSYFSEFLLNQKIKYITVTMNWGVLAEMGFLIMIPVAIRKYGIRNVMIIGLVAMLVRYLSFYMGGIAGQQWPYYIGILVHGLIFGCFYVGGQIYVDKKATDDLKSQAQGFIFLVTFGIGLLTGNLISGAVIHYFSNIGGDSELYNWNAIWIITTISSIVVLLAFILFFRNESVKKQGE